MYCPFRPVSCAHELVHKSTCNTRILDKSLEATRFLKKKSLYYIGISLKKRGFALHGFFLEQKTAYLEALLYFIKCIL